MNKLFKTLGGVFRRAQIPTEYFTMVEAILDLENEFSQFTETQVKDRINNLRSKYQQNNKGHFLILENILFHNLWCDQKINAMFFGHIHILKDKAGLSLGNAKKIKDRLINNDEIIELFIEDELLAKEILEDAIKLKVKGRIE